MTCWHVARTERVRVYFGQYEAGGALITNAEFYLNEIEPVMATVVASSQEQDLAILQLDRIPAGVGVLELGSRAVSDSPVIVVGHPVSPSVPDRLWEKRSTTVAAVGFCGNAAALQDGSRIRTMYWGFNVHGGFAKGFSGAPVVNEFGEAVGILVQSGQGKTTAACAGAGEIRRLCGKVSGDPVFASGDSGFVGCWGAYESENNEVVSASGFTFLDDGTFFFMTTDGALKGRYQWSGKQLTFVSRENVLLEGEVRWNNDNSFDLIPSASHGLTRRFIRYQP